MQKGNTAAAGKDDCMKVLTDLVQTLVSQLKNQSTTTDGKQSHQKAMQDFLVKLRSDAMGALHLDISLETVQRLTDQEVILIGVGESPLHPKVNHNQVVL